MLSGRFSGLLLILATLMVGVGVVLVEARDGAGGSRSEDPGGDRRIVLIAGGKSHGPGAHEYVKTVRLLKVMLDRAENLEGISTELYDRGWPDDPGAFEGADLVMMVSDGQDGDLYSPVPFMETADRMHALGRAMDDGAGLVTFHFSTFTPDSLGSQVLEWVGGYFDWQGADGDREWYSAIQTLDTTVVVASPDHPISRGLPPTFRLHDEFYHNLRFAPDDARLRPILRVPALEGERDRGGVVAWAVEREDGGRGFGTTTGHFFANWSNPDYRKLILNGIVWAAGGEVPQDGVESRFYTDEEVTAILYDASIKGLLLTGRHHPAHPWRLTTPILQSILEEDERVHIDVSEDIEDLYEYDLEDYGFLLLNYANWEDPSGLSENAKKSLVEYLAGGGGLVVVHFANGAFHYSLPHAAESDWPEYRRIVRRVWDHDSDSGHDAFGPFEVEVTAIRHEITEGMKPFTTVDELYYNQKGGEPIEPLLTARSRDTGRDEPMAWAYSYGEGRVFQTVLGHDTASLRAPEVRTLLRRAGSWAAGVPQR